MSYCPDCADLIREKSALEARVRELEAALHDQRWQHAQELKRAEQAEAALSVAQKDAERWRYVRDTWEGQAPELFYWHEGECIKHNPVSISACKQLDAAIDAAIAHGGAGEGERNG